jgi:hypothetical protein
MNNGASGSASPTATGSTEAVTSSLASSSCPLPSASAMVNGSMEELFEAAKSSNPINLEALMSGLCHLAPIAGGNYLFCPRI